MEQEEQEVDSVSFRKRGSVISGLEYHKLTKHESRDDPAQEGPALKMYHQLQHSKTCSSYARKAHHRILHRQK